MEILAPGARSADERVETQLADIQAAIAEERAAGDALAEVLARDGVGPADFAAEETAEKRLDEARAAADALLGGRRA